MKLSLFIFSMLFSGALCAQRQVAPEYYNGTHVGDILPDPTLDDSAFKLCDENYVPQYYMVGIGYQGEMIAVKRKCLSTYKPVDVNESGLITIRFAMNCQGKTGRFRVQELNKEYKVYKFDVRITSQLVSITKGLDKWKPGSSSAGASDSYVYLTFKIENGKLIDVLP